MRFFSWIHLSGVNVLSIFLINPKDFFPQKNSFRQQNAPRDVLFFWSCELATRCSGKKVQMLKKVPRYLTSYCIVWEDLWCKLKFFSAMKSWVNEFVVKPYYKSSQKWVENGNFSGQNFLRLWLEFNIILNLIVVIFSNTRALSLATYCRKPFKQRSRAPWLS